MKYKFGVTFKLSFFMTHLYANNTGTQFGCTRTTYHSHACGKVPRETDTTVQFLCDVVTYKKRGEVLVQWNRRAVPKNSPVSTMTSMRSMLLAKASLRLIWWKDTMLPSRFARSKASRLFSAFSLLIWFL